MRLGVNRDSHGVKVAQLAGIPASAVKVAKQTLSLLQQSKPVEARKAAKLALFGQMLTAQDATNI